MKRPIMGREVVVAVTSGARDFGPWAQIFSGQFDGRRPRRVLVPIIGESPQGWRLGQKTAPKSLCRFYTLWYSPRPSMKIARWESVTAQQGGRRHVEVAHPRQAVCRAEPGHRHDDHAHGRLDLRLARLSSKLPARRRPASRAGGLERTASSGRAARHEIAAGSRAGRPRRPGEQGLAGAVLPSQLPRCASEKQQPGQPRR